MKNYNTRCRQIISVLKALPHYSCICTYDDWVVQQDAQGRLWLHDNDSHEVGEWHEVECVYVQEVGNENYGNELDTLDFNYAGEADDLSCFLYFKLKEVTI